MKQSSKDEPMETSSSSAPDYSVSGNVQPIDIRPQHVEDFDPSNVPSTSSAKLTAEEV